jgi:predicted RND superfamily exporter protein
MKFAKIAKFLLWALMGISLVLVGIFFFGGFVEGTAGTSAAEPLITETILRWAYALLIITAFFALGFPLVFIFENLKSAKRLGIVIVIGAVLIFISNRLASDELLNLIQYTGPDNVPGTLKTVGTFLIFTYILGIVAILSILYSSIANLFR